MAKFSPGEIIPCEIVPGRNFPPPCTGLRGTGGQARRGMVSPGFPSRPQCPHPPPPFFGCTHMLPDCLSLGVSKDSGAVGRHFLTMFVHFLCRMRIRRALRDGLVQRRCGASPSAVPLSVDKGTDGCPIPCGTPSVHETASPITSDDDDDEMVHAHSPASNAQGRTVPLGSLREGDTRHAAARAFSPVPPSFLSMNRTL